MGRTKSKQSSSSFWYSRSRAASAPTAPRPEPAADDPPIGCMSMVHYLIFAPGAGCVGRPPSSSNAIVTPHNNCSGDDRRRHRDGDNNKMSAFEAPRNSLDLDADNPNDIQIGVQIEPAFDALARTNLRRHKPTAPSSEAETPRTPSLVARLMGIDGLPDQASPSPASNKKPSSKKHAAAAGDVKENCCYSAPPAKDSSSSSSSKEKKKRVIPESMNRREPLRSLSCNVVEARSLPETPRGSTSTSARASWDGPRLSLQALKESVLDRAAHYMSMPSSPTSSSAAAAAGARKKKDGGRRRRDERERERVAKEHAREILRQAKENVASRNKSSSSSSSTKNKSSSSPAPEKRPSSRSSFFDNKENVQAPTPAVVMEDKLVVVVQKPPTVVATRAPGGGTEHPPPSHSPRVPLAPRQPPPPPPPQRAKPSRPPPPPPPLDPPARARKPDGCERFATRIKKPSVTGAQQQAPAAAAPVTSLPSAPAMSSSAAAAASVTLRQQQRHASPPAAVPLEEDPEYRYLRTVLERVGFMRSSPPPPRRPEHHRLFKQGSYSVASPPVDPIVFHLLELELPADEARLGPLRHRWNRKLLFHLAQELLADLLLPAAAAAPPMALTTGLPLLGKVWRKVRSFPAADCRVVGDIDALVAADLLPSPSPARRMAEHPAVAEEADDVAEEVAERVLQALLGECVEESISLHRT